MRYARYIVILVLASLGNVFGEPSTSLRVWKTYPDTLDLMLTSVFRPDGVTPQAAFNHRRGKTFFAHAGERVGPYTVYRISSSGRQSASAVLIDTRTSEAFTLYISTRTPLKGLRAQLADLARAQLWDVREGDELAAHGIRVESIAASNVTASSVSGAVEIPPISQVERASLEAAWARTRTERAVALAAAEKVKAEEAERVRLEEAALQRASAQAAPRMNVALRRQQRFFYGTEYRVPSSYVYYYALQPDGRWGPVPQVIAVPAEFETRKSGWSLTVSPP